MRDFDVFYNLGVIYTDLVRYDDAIIYFGEALVLCPTDFATHANLGAIYLRRNDYDNAAAHYSEALRVQPENQEIAYLLAASKQQKAPEQAPTGYVKNLFDQYASYYEKHLQLLEYKVPEILLEEVHKIYEEPKHNLRILDLGCGTGAVGWLLKPYARFLVGIDLSENMLAETERKHVYDELQLFSIDDALKYYKEMDLVIAADTLVYCGNLDDIFVGCKKALIDGGVFAFSIEKAESYPYSLQHTARFAHNTKYVEELAAKNGFMVLVCHDIVLRKNQNVPINGVLFILKLKT